MTPSQLTAGRDQLNLNQAELARSLGVAANTVNRWEAGTRSIPPYLWLALEGLRHQPRVLEMRDHKIDCDMDQYCHCDQA